MNVMSKDSLTLEAEMFALGRAARDAAAKLRGASTETKNKALVAAADAIRAHQFKILAANAEDMKSALSRNLSPALMDRLKLDPKRVEATAKGVADVAALPDPVGRELARWQMPNGLDIARVATPIGVLGIIYESRPNVTADAGALCIKSGNAATSSRPLAIASTRFSSSTSRSTIDRVSPRPVAASTSLALTASKAATSARNAAAAARRAWFFAAVGARASSPAAARAARPIASIVSASSSRVSVAVAVIVFACK